MFLNIFLLLQQNVLGLLCIFPSAVLELAISSRNPVPLTVGSDTGNKNLGAEGASFYKVITAPRSFQWTELETIYLHLYIYIYIYLHKHEFIVLLLISNPQRFFFSLFHSLYLSFLIVRFLIPQKSQYIYSLAQSGSNEIATPLSLPTTTLSCRFLCISFCP